MLRVLGGGETGIGAELVGGIPKTFFQRAVGRVFFRWSDPVHGYYQNYRLRGLYGRTRYAISAMASPSVSILSSYNASGAKGAVVVGPGRFSPADGWTLIIRIDFPASPGLGKAYRSVKSSRA